MSRAGSLIKSSRAAPVPFISYGFALVLVTCTVWSVDATSPALPSMQDDFGLSAAAAGLIVSFLFVGRLIGNFPAPRLLDSLGSPRTASMGGVLLVAGASINLFAPTVEVLYVGRVLQGAGISLLVNAGLRSILVARPGRGVAMTQYGIAATVGGVLGLQSGGLLTGHFGWRSIFALSASLGIFLIILPMISTRASRRSTQQTEAAATAANVLPIPLRSYLPLLLVNFLIFGNYSIWVILPLYAQQTFDATPEVTANLLLIITITHLAAAIPVSRAIRRVGAPRVLVVSVVFAGIGAVSVLLAPSLWWLAIPLIFYGAGMVGSVNCAGDIVLQRGGASARAVGSLRQTSDLGLVVGPLLAGVITDAFSYDAAFIFFPAIMICAAVVGIAVPGGLVPRNAPEAV